MTAWGRLTAAASGIFLLSFSPGSAYSATVEFDKRFTTIVEETSPDPLLRFEYRLWPSAEVTSTVVTVDGAPIDARATGFGENPLNTSALMFLVDSSAGTARQTRTASVNANKQAIVDILNSVQPRTQVGIFTFANDLTEISPMGAPASQARSAVLGIRADGMGTRLYRRAIDAIEKLAAVKADRKALLIFSDGKDEDTGYTLDNLLDAAKKAGIIVMAVGCPESAQDVPALGNLERLAADTQGFYRQMQLPDAGKGGPPVNPKGLAADILQSLDGGGEVVASLKGVGPTAKVTVTLTTAGGQKLEESLVRVPPPTPTPSPTATPGGSPAATPSASPDPSASPSPTPVPTPTPTAAQKAVTWAKANLAWVIVGAVAIIGLIVIGIVAAASASRRKKVAIQPDFEFDHSPPAPQPDSDSGARSAALAYLVMQDASASRMPITRTATRIGRRSDNDIVFSNDSVSGHHAELHMGRDGTFTITDLGSGNGVMVNGKSATQTPLRDGDLIELGEVRFRFSISES